MTLKQRLNKIERLAAEPIEILSLEELKLAIAAMTEKDYADIEDHPLMSAETQRTLLRGFE